MTNASAPIVACNPRNKLFVTLILVLFATLPKKYRDAKTEVAREVMKHLRPGDAIKAARAVVHRLPSEARKTIREVVLERTEICRRRGEAKAFSDPYTEPVFHRLTAKRHKLATFRQLRAWDQAMDWMVQNMD